MNSATISRAMGRNIKTRLISLPCISHSSTQSPVTGAVRRHLCITRPRLDKCCASKETGDEEKSSSPLQRQSTASVAFWSSKPTWYRASLNTLRCLVGCTTGDFSAMWLLQTHYPDLGMPAIMGISMAAGISTSMILETVLLRLGKDQLSWPVAAKTAAGMSLISMITMELAENVVDYSLTGGAVAFDSPTFWMAAVVSMGAGFLAPLPYNYHRLRSTREFKQVVVLPNRHHYLFFRPLHPELGGTNATLMKRTPVNHPNAQYYGKECHAYRVLISMFCCDRRHLMAADELGRHGGPAREPIWRIDAAVNFYLEEKPPASNDFILPGKIVVGAETTGLLFLAGYVHWAILVQRSARIACPLVGTVAAQQSEVANEVQFLKGIWQYEEAASESHHEQAQVSAQLGEETSEVVWQKLEKAK
ncbi:hypothetical protein NQ176_g6798 [Zarea fungicola]|uniref:Uncharacterized protein n=1 Tax=Zarea fungicola TaxID=93591 RepID=A0ACC1N1Y8_9HYPO|nr:hypothetical protein NQ176_g6798 [Lecanicillium fungicola]